MYLRSDPPWFAFLTHPRDVGDIFRWKGSRLLREYSDSDEELVAKWTSLEPMVSGELVFGFGGPRGEMVAVTRMPEQLMGPYGRSVVADAARLAVDRGARVIGLGALTAPATAAGRSLVRDLPAGVAVTSGNAYTAAVSRRNVIAAVTALGLDRPARVAVLGATGSVGGPVSRLLVQDGFDVTVIGRNPGRVRAMFGDLAGEAVLADTLEPLLKADVVLVLTSERSALLTPREVRPGAIVIDVTQPANILPGAYQEFHADGSRVVPGGLVQIPGYHSSYDFVIPIPGATYACLAETYLLAREGIREHSVGVPSVAAALQMERLAERHGVAPAVLDFTLPAPIKNGARV